MIIKAAMKVRNTHPGEALIFLPLGVLQPLHQFGVSEQVSVQRAVFG